MSRIIGYARVSTEDQNLDMQKMAIEKYAEEQGLELILYEEKISTRKTGAYRITTCTKSCDERRPLRRVQTGPSRT